MILQSQQLNGKTSKKYSQVNANCFPSLLFFLMLCLALVNLKTIRSMNKKMFSHRTIESFSLGGFRNQSTRHSSKSLLCLMVPALGVSSKSFKRYYCLRLQSPLLQFTMALLMVKKLSMFQHPYQIGFWNPSSSFSEDHSTQHQWKRRMMKCLTCGRSEKILNWAATNVKAFELPKLSGSCIPHTTYYFRVRC